LGCNDGLCRHAGVGIWNIGRKLDIMPPRQLQPAAHSLLAGYLLLRISLHEWLQRNISALLELPKTVCVCVWRCVCLYSIFTRLHAHAQMFSAMLSEDADKLNTRRYGLSCVTLYMTHTHPHTYAAVRAPQVKQKKTCSSTCLKRPDLG